MKSQLVWTDCTNREVCPSEVFDLIVTSPPYNFGKAYDGEEANDLLDYPAYLEFTRQWLFNCFYWAKSPSRICINTAVTSNIGEPIALGHDILRVAMEMGWKYKTTIIWKKGSVNKRTAWGSWLSASAPNLMSPTEFIYVLYKGAWKKENRGQSDMTKKEFMDWVLGYWAFTGESSKRIGHEAPFPRELPKRCIKLFSYVGDVVFDPFVREWHNDDRGYFGLIGLQ